MPGSKDEGHESSLTPPTEEEEAAGHEGRDATMAEAQQRCDRLSARRIPTGWPPGAGILMVPNAGTGDFDVRVVPGPIIEQLDQAMIDPLRNDDDDDDDDDDGGFAHLFVNSTGTVATVGRPQGTEGWRPLPPAHPSYVPPPRHPDAANDETNDPEHGTPIATLTIIR